MNSPVSGFFPRMSYTKFVLNCAKVTINGPRWPYGCSHKIYENKEDAGEMFRTICIVYNILSPLVPTGTLTHKHINKLNLFP